MCCYRKIKSLLSIIIILGIFYTYFQWHHLIINNSTYEVKVSSNFNISIAFKQNNVLCQVPIVNNNLILPYVGSMYLHRQYR